MDAASGAGMRIGLLPICRARQVIPDRWMACAGTRVAMRPTRPFHYLEGDAKPYDASKLRISQIRIASSSREGSMPEIGHTALSGSFNQHFQGS